MFNMNNVTLFWIIYSCTFDEYYFSSRCKILNYVSRVHYLDARFVSNKRITVIVKCNKTNKNGQRKPSLPRKSSLFPATQADRICGYFCDSFLLPGSLEVFSLVQVSLDLWYRVMRSSILGLKQNNFSPFPILPLV